MQAEEVVRVTKRFSYTAFEPLIDKTKSSAAFIAACASFAYLVGFIAFNLLSYTILHFTDLSVSSAYCIVLSILLAGLLCSVAILIGIARFSENLFQKLLDKHPKAKKWILGGWCFLTLLMNAASIIWTKPRHNQQIVHSSKTLFIGHILYIVLLLIATTFLIAPTDILKKQKSIGKSRWMNWFNAALALLCFITCALFALIYMPQSLGGMAPEQKLFWVSPDAAKVLMQCKDPKSTIPQINSQEPISFNYTVMHTTSSDTLIWCGPKDSIITLSNSSIIASMSVPRE